jgi:lipopolysaccharide/colanic/teichoic acid biosynthesis glycosyltransferase
MSSIATDTVIENGVDSWQLIEEKHSRHAAQEQSLANPFSLSTPRSTSKGLYPFVKRGMDIFGALVGIGLSIPFLVIAAILIWLEDRGPVFFIQNRIGKDGLPFPCLKLRTMVKNADALKAKLLEENVHGDNRTFKHANDPRITKVGRILRKLSIDEFPQFVNVLLGHMSIVGPRPAIKSEVDLYKPSDRVRLQVKPGLTCLWQISGRSSLSFEAQVQLDAKYIAEMSFTNDIAIIAKTIPAILSCHGAR